MQKTANKKEASVLYNLAFQNVYLKIGDRIEGSKQTQERYADDDDILPDLNLFALNLFCGLETHRTQCLSRLKCTIDSKNIRKS